MNTGNNDDEINPDTDNMILEDLKKEDMLLDAEINSIKHFPDSTYNFSFNKLLKFPDSVRRVIPSYLQNECFSLRFEKLDGMIAAGYSNGYICVYNTDNSCEPKCMKASDYPVTCIRWKPHDNLKPKNVLISVTADGLITHWHTSTSKILHTMEEKNNPIMCVDYSPDGTLFATGGSDHQVKLYDDNTKTIIRHMTSNIFTKPGHSNRVFCINFHKENHNLMASGGWDNTIQLYDIREGTVKDNFYGPHICGDSVDMKGNYILTGSWAVKNQIQLWDIRTMKLIKQIEWDKDVKFHSTYIYAAQFSKKGNLFGVGGSNNNTCRVFENDTEDNYPQVDTKYLSSPVYSLDFSNNGKSFAYGCGDGNIRIYDISK